MDGFVRSRGCPESCIRCDDGTSAIAPRQVDSEDFAFHSAVVVPCRYRNLGAKK